MSSLSIRSRLTVVIVALTAVVSAIGVLFGVQLLEGQVRDAAIDERREEFEIFTEEFDDLVFPGEEFDLGELAAEEFALEGVDAAGVDGEFVEAELGDGEMGAFDDAFVVGQSVLASELDVIGQVATMIPELGQIRSEIATDDDELLFWLNQEAAAKVELSGRAELVDREDYDVPVIPVTDLFLLDQRLFEIDGFESNLELELQVHTVDGVDVAFLAEVTDELDALGVVREVLRNVVIVLTVLAGIATWFIAGRALRPVGDITNRVEEITSGTLSDRVPEPAGNDEIGVLARTMNKMLGRLENTDLRRRQFVSDASHELRTPVAVLKSEAEVAKRAPESTNLADFSTVVLGESKRLEGLVEDLLALARSDESRRLTATAAIDVDEIVLEEASRSRPLPIDQSSVSAGRVVGHDDDMRRVVAHLLDNAARHGRTSVAVGVRTAEGVVQVWVDDDGPGISEGERKRVFDRFVRLDDARTRDAGGAGLGLAVVHETVTRMEGEVKVDRSPLGGARFLLEFPAA